MPYDWEEKMTDPKERKVFEALSDPDWDFRTVAGLSRSAGISEAEVAAILGKYPDLIRKSAVPTRDGAELFTLRSRDVTFKERLAEARLIISKSVK